MFARRTAEGVLQHITGYSAIFAEPTAYIALFTTAPIDDSGTGAIEVSGGAYARVVTTQGTSGTWAAASTTTDPTTEANALAITFPTATANWGTVVAFGIYDAATAGNLLAWDWLGNYEWLPTTISAASPGVFTAHAHGYAANDPVVFSVVFGGTAPTLAGGSGALGSNNVSLVVSPATDTLTLTTGGTAVNTTATGNGMIRKIVQQSVPSGVQPSFASGQLVLQAA
jgi:hypothetical protein